MEPKSMILDQLIFAPAPLPLCYDWTEGLSTEGKPGEQHLDTYSSLSMEVEAHGSPRRLKIGAPGMVRGISADKLGYAWQEFCGLLRHFGMPLQCQVEDLEPIAAAYVPARLGRVLVQQPLSLSELQTADFIELSLRIKGSAWGWPVELGEPKRLPSFISALRLAAGDGTLVGIELPVGADEADIAEVIAARADFITLHGERLDDLAVWGLARARRQVNQALSSADFPIFLDLPVRDVLDAVKCLALGASVVNLNPILRKQVEQQAAASVGRSTQSQSDSGRRFTAKLPSIAVGPTAEQAKLSGKLRGELSRFRDELLRCIKLCGARSLAEFDQSCLRASDRRVAELTGIRPLQEA